MGDVTYFQSGSPLWCLCAVSYRIRAQTANGQTPSTSHLSAATPTLHTYLAGQFQSVLQSRQLQVVARMSKKLSVSEVASRYMSAFSACNCGDSPISSSQLQSVSDAVEHVISNNQNSEPSPVDVPEVVILALQSQILPRVAIADVLPFLHQDPFCDVVKILEKLDGQKKGMLEGFEEYMSFVNEPNIALLLQLREALGYRYTAFNSKTLLVTQRGTDAGIHTPLESAVSSFSNRLSGVPGRVFFLRQVPGRQLAAFEQPGQSERGAHGDALHALLLQSVGSPAVCRQLWYSIRLFEMCGCQIDRQNGTACRSVMWTFHHTGPSAPSTGSTASAPAMKLHAFPVDTSLAVLRPSSAHAVPAIFEMVWAAPDDYRELLHLDKVDALPVDMGRFLGPRTSLSHRWSTALYFLSQAGLPYADITSLLQTWSALLLLNAMRLTLLEVPHTTATSIGNPPSTGTTTAADEDGTATTAEAPTVSGGVSALLTHVGMLLGDDYAAEIEAYMGEGAVSVGGLEALIHTVYSRMFTVFVRTINARIAAMSEQLAADAGISTPRGDFVVFGAPDVVCPPSDARSIAFASPAALCRASIASLLAQNCADSTGNSRRSSELTFPGSRKERSALLHEFFTAEKGMFECLTAFADRLRGAPDVLAQVDSSGMETMVESVLQRFVESRLPSASVVDDCEACSSSDAARNNAAIFMSGERMGVMNVWWTADSEPVHRFSMAEMRKFIAGAVLEYIHTDTGLLRTVRTALSTLQSACDLIHAGNAAAASLLDLSDRPSKSPPHFFPLNVPLRPDTVISIPAPLLRHSFAPSSSPSPSTRSKLLNAVSGAFEGFAVAEALRAMGVADAEVLVRQVPLRARVMRFETLLVRTVLAVMRSRAERDRESGSASGEDDWEAVDVCGLSVAEKRDRCQRILDEYMPHDLFAVRTTFVVLSARALDAFDEIITECRRARQHMLLEDLLSASPPSSDFEDLPLTTTKTPRHPATSVVRFTEHVKTRASDANTVKKYWLQNRQLFTPAVSQYPLSEIGSSVARPIFQDMSMGGDEGDSSGFGDVSGGIGWGESEREGEREGDGGSDDGEATTVDDSDSDNEEREVDGDGNVEEGNGHSPSSHAVSVTIAENDTMVSLSTTSSPQKSSTNKKTKKAKKSATAKAKRPDVVIPTSSATKASEPSSKVEAKAATPKQRKKKKRRISSAVPSFVERLYKPRKPGAGESSTPLECSFHPAINPESASFTVAEEEETRRAMRQKIGQKKRSNAGGAGKVEDRLLQKGEEYKNKRIERVRQQQEMEESIIREQYRNFSPVINEKSSTVQHNRRTVETKMSQWDKTTIFLHEKERHKAEMRQHLDDEERLRCPFAPHITQKARHLTRTEIDLHNWHSAREERTSRVRRHREELEEGALLQKPMISERSRAMAVQKFRSAGEVNAADRLYHIAVERLRSQKATSSAAERADERSQTAPENPVVSTACSRLYENAMERVEERRKTNEYFASPPMTSRNYYGEGGGVNASSSRGVGDSFAGDEVEIRRFLSSHSAGRHNPVDPYAFRHIFEPQINEKSVTLAESYAKRLSLQRSKLEASASPSAQTSAAMHLQSSVSPSRGGKSDAESPPVSTHPGRRMFASPEDDEDLRGVSQPIDISTIPPIPKARNAHDESLSGLDLVPEISGDHQLASDRRPGNTERRIQFADVDDTDTNATTNLSSYNGSRGGNSHSNSNGSSRSASPTKRHLAHTIWAEDDDSDYKSSDTEMSERGRRGV